MEVEPFLQIIYFVALIFLSAFFSGSEAAYFSLSKEMVDGLKESASHKSKRIVNLLRKPRHLLITILVGNTVVNVAAASIAAILTADLSAKFHFSMDVAIILEVVVVTMVLLIFSELTPKIIAVKNPFQFASAVSLPLIVINYILLPIVLVLDKFPALFSGFFSVRLKKHLLS